MNKREQNEKKKKDISYQTEPLRKTHSKMRDMNSKTIFHNPVLCAQFLRDNFDIPMLKEIQPEDIEDVSERYRTYLGIEFEADTVKKIWLKGKKVIPLYIISLIEHKSKVDYNVIMQLLRYMVCIWTDYEKECNRKRAGSSAGKDFRYPPILPIVYYEGTGKWTAELHLKNRILMQEIFQDYIPDFTYRLVRLHDYSNEELLSREDEMSLLMLINKIQNAEDLGKFVELPKEKIEHIIKKAPEHVLEIIALTIWSLCMKMNVSQEDAKQCVEKVKERQMGYLFENMEKMDIQAERRNTAEARKQAEEAQKRAEEAQRKLQESEKKKKEMETIAIEAVISICQEFNTTKAETIAKVMDKCMLSQTEAEAKVNQYWKE